jgi:hypothetical protein
MIKESEETSEFDTAMDNTRSSIKWTQNSRGIAVEVKEVKGDPITEEFRIKNSEMFDKIILDRNKKQSDMKADLIRRKEIENQ